MVPLIHITERLEAFRLQLDCKLKGPEDLDCCQPLILNGLGIK